MLAVFGVTMLPWFMYNYVTLGRLTLSPAGGVGRGLWEGSWQATWSGRLQNELTHLADDIDNRAELDRAVEGVAAREHLPAGPMLEYVHQWEDIRLIWTEPVDPYERAMSRMKADQEYQRVALDNLRRDSLRPSRQAPRAGHLHPVGRRNPVPLQRHRSNAAMADSPRLESAGARSVWRRSPVLSRSSGRGRWPARACSLHRSCT